MDKKFVLQCSAITKEGRHCHFKGLHIVNEKRFCGNHAAIERALDKAKAIAHNSPTVIPSPLFGPTQESLKLAREAMEMNSETAIAYMIDGFVANALRKANNKD